MAVAVMSPMHSWNHQLGHEVAECSYQAALGFSVNPYYTAEGSVEEPAPSRYSDNGAEPCSSTASVDDTELREKVKKQVEWYFGDENLLKDSFLMKHINRNKQGHVSLKLVASLRKVKALTKDWTVVQESVRHSKLLELNDDGTKIRRLAPVPQVDYARLPKTIIITDYHTAEPSTEDVEEEFGRHGEIATVQILQPGKAIPLDVKSCRAQHPAIGKDLCILVEYRTPEAARKAWYRNSSSENWRQTMAVKLLVEPESNKVKEVEKQSKKESGKKQKSEKVEKAKPKRGGGAEKEGHPKQLSKLSRLNGKHHTSTPDYNSDSGYSGRSASSSPMPSPKLARKAYSEQRHTVPLTSRLAGEAVRPTSHLQRPAKDVSVVVVRQPHGPDGSRGFHKRTLS